MKTRSDDLKLLLAVVDSRSFTAAADLLDIQVAKVSRAISRLESQLEITLLARTTRRLELTEEGAEFVAKVRDGLQLLEQAEDVLMNRGQAPRGRLRVDAASPFVLHQLVPLMDEFQQLYPEVKLELTSNEGFIDLLEQRTDVAIRIGKLTDSNLTARPLGKSPLHLVASPAYLEEFGTPSSPAELDQHRTVGFIGAKALNRWPLPGKPYFEPNIAADSGEVVRQLALGGRGIACLSNFMVSRDFEQKALLPVLGNCLVPDKGRELVSAVYYRTSRVSSRVSTFLDFIQPRLTL